MKKFIVIYHAPVEFMKDPASPEEKTESMKAWMLWAEKCGDSLVDMGAPLMNGVQLSPDGTSIKSERNVAGFSVLQAEDIEAAKSLMEGHPHFEWNAACSIEVHEIMPLPGV